MPVPRDHPYIWATWLPRLLTGENSCEWAVWFKAHHQDWTRTPSEFNQAQWMLDHTALLNEHITNWEVGGLDVDVEAQNRFELRGKSATLAGRPDLVARRDDEAVIVDAKTAQENPSHVVQVMIYLYAVPKTLEKYRNLKPKGQVTYRDHTVRIPADAVNDPFVQNLGTLIRRLSADEPARRSPAGRNASSTTSVPLIVQNEWTNRRCTKGKPSTSNDRTADTRHCSSTERPDRLGDT